MCVCTVVLQKSAHSRKSAHPYFWPNFLYTVKVYSNERPPWSELCMEFEKHSPKRYAYLREETLCNTSLKVNTKHSLRRRM